MFIPNYNLIVILMTIHFILHRQLISASVGGTTGTDGASGATTGNDRCNAPVCAKGSVVCEASEECNCHCSYNDPSSDQNFSNDPNSGKNHTIYACEDNIAAFDCSNGTTIDVLDAMYGRLMETICPGPYVGTIYCPIAYNLTTYVKTKCQQKETCTFATGWYAYNVDPCPYISKYTEVVYRCLK